MARTEFSLPAITVAVACGTGAVLSGASVMVNSATVFIEPITREFGWRRGTLSGIMLVGLLAAGLATPLIGRLVDRFGARVVVLTGVVAFSMTTMAISALSASLVMSGSLFAILGLTAPALGAVAFNKAISAWFHAKRGIVLALVGTGGAVGALIIPKLSYILIGWVGWRDAYIGLGAVVLAILLPVMTLFFREPPPGLVDAPIGPGPIPETALGFTTAEALRTRSFWLTVGAIAANVFVGIGLQIHSVPLLEDRGLSDAEAVNLTSIFGIGQVAGQLAAGWLLDRFDTPRVVVPFFVAALLGLLLLDHGSGAAMLLLAGLLLRVGIGAELSIAPYLLARFFGLKSFAQIYGLLFMVSTLAAGIGVQGMSYSFDHYRTYQPALMVSEGMLALGVVFVLLLGPYVFAVKPQVHA